MIRFTLCALATGFLLAACGGGEGTANSAPAASTKIETTASVAVPAAAPTPVTTTATTTTPPLVNSEATLSAAMKCSGNFGPDAGRAVLLVPGATQTVESNFSWSYIPALEKAGIAWCAVDLPNKHTAELQNSSEFVTYAIRKMYETTKTKIAIVGFSQGGVLPRWSLKYFPDTRDMVEDYIGIAAAHHGLIETNLLCAVPVLGCVTSFTQIAVGANWIDSLNAGGETFKGIDYTQIYTRTDDVAIPNFDAKTGVSSLRTGEGTISNIATQDVCPLNVADHFTLGSFDPVGYALVLDALRSPGPASLARVKGQGLGLCLQIASPGIDVVALPVNFATKMMFTFATSVSLQPKSTKEPALKCYATGGC